MVVSFEEEPQRYTRPERPVGGMTGWLIRKNIVKNPKQANYIFIGVIIFCFATTLFLLIEGSTTETLPTEQLEGLNAQ